MRICSIFIQSYGKFQNHKIEFDKGFNEFVHHNEYGKSTILSFIYFMLYGHKRTLKKGLELTENPLKKYMPWQGNGYISGAMEIEKNGTIYTIERRQTESGNMRERLLFAADGRTAEYSGDIGSFFFGVDGETFAKSYFIGQTNEKFFKTEGMERALKNLITTGDEDTSFAKAITLLQEQKKKYQHGNRKSGPIFDMERELVFLELDLKEVRQDISALEQQYAELENNNEQCRELERQIEDLEQARPKAAAYDAHRLLKDAQLLDEQLKLRHAELEKMTQKAPVSEAQAQLISELFRRRAEALGARQGDLDRKEGLRTEISAIENELEHQKTACQQTSSPYLSPGVWLSITLLILLGIAAVFFKSYIIIVPALVLLLPMAWIFLKIAKRRIYRAAGVKNSRALKAMRIDCGIKQSGLEFRRQELERLCTKITDHEKVIQEIEAERKNIETQYGIPDMDALRERQLNAQRLPDIKRDIELINTQLNRLYGGKDLAELKDCAEKYDGSVQTSGSAIERRISELRGELASLLAAKNDLQRTGLEIERLYAKLYDLEEQKNRLPHKLESAKRHNDGLALAILGLQEAYTKLSGEYAPSINDKASALLCEITNGRYNEILVDSELNIKLRTPDGIKELGYFSKGTADAVYFAVRQAVCALISGDEQLPILLDDPFSALDKERRARVMELCRIIAEKRQVILFSAV